MCKDELRIAGAEKVIIALAPWLTDRSILEARANLRADLATTPHPEERIACLQTVELISGGVRRLRLFNPGAWVRAGG